MKPTKQKHGKENLIGKIIYAFLMFIPLLAIGVTCAYAIINKNAYQSYSNSNIIKKTSLVDANGNVEQGIQYDVHMEYGTGVNSVASTIYYYSDISINWTDYGAPSSYNYNGFQVYQSNTNYFVYLIAEGSVQHTFWAGLTTFGNIFDFSFVASQNFNQNGKQMLKLYTFTYDKLTIDNVFYYSIDKVQQSPLFNWSSNTTTYSVLETTCTTLGITSQFIPMLLSYWLMMSLMYLLYDIALLVVHMAHNRIHDIESSM